MYESCLHSVLFYFSKLLRRPHFSYKVIVCVVACTGKFFKYSGREDFLIVTSPVNEDVVHFILS